MYHKGAVHDVSYINLQTWTMGKGKKGKVQASDIRVVLSSIGVRRRNEIITEAIWEELLLELIERMSEFGSPRK